MRDRGPASLISSVLSSVLGLSSLVLVAGGCGPTGKMGEMKTFADEMCACTEVECTNTVLAKYQAFVNNNPSIRANEAKQKAFADELVRFLQCRSDKLSTDGKPTQLPQ